VSDVSDATPAASEAPVFVFGADHSGTTVLYLMLAYHPDLTWFSQFSLRGGEIPGRRAHPIAARFDRPLRVLSHPWRKEQSRVRRVVVPHPGEERTIWNYLLEDNAPGSVRLRENLKIQSERHGGRRVLAKRPSFYRHLHLLRTAFPNACFVHIVRDGRPVALSLRAKELTTAERAGRPADPGDALEAAARFWTEVLERTQKLSPPQLIEVRYEDLCTDVHATLRAILRKAQLDVDSFPFRRCPMQLTSRNSHWLAAASAPELETISRIEAEQLIRHGYPVA
jgi:hypothetical protein